MKKQLLLLALFGLSMLAFVVPAHAYTPVTLDVKYSGYYPSYAGSPYSYPLFNYTSGGVSYVVPLTNTVQSITVDNDSDWYTSSPVLLDGSYWTANGTTGEVVAHESNPAKLDVAYTSSGAYNGNNQGNNLQQGQFGASFFSLTDPVLGGGWTWVALDGLVLVVVLLKSDSALLAIALFDIGLIFSGAAYPAQIASFAVVGLIVSIVGGLYKAYSGRPQ
jgi:hypothetical protein